MVVFDLSQSGGAWAGALQLSQGFFPGSLHVRVAHASVKMSNDDRRCREALRLWLSWNAEHDRLTESLFQEREQAARLEELLDTLDILRTKAVTLSQEVLSV